MRYTIHMKNHAGPSFGTNEELPNSWGEHVFDDDYDPSVQLTEDELLARDIDSFGRTTEKKQMERIQELFERSVNEECTDIEELVELAKADVDGLSYEEIQYGDKSVTVIKAAGYPLKFLKSIISNSEVVADPSKWTSIDEEVYREAVENGNILSNTICVSYINTDINPEQAVGGIQGLTLVFTHVEPNSVLGAGPSDIFSDRADGDTDSKLDKDMTLDRVASEGRANEFSYNEITLKRYGENGKALLPTAIMLNETDDPATCERALRAAAYFGVPIIQVMRDKYEVHDYIQNDEDDAFDASGDDYTFY